MDVLHSRLFTRGRFHPRVFTRTRGANAHTPHPFPPTTHAGTSSSSPPLVRTSTSKRTRARRLATGTKKRNTAAPTPTTKPRRSRVHTEERKSASPRSSPTRAATRTSLPTLTYSSRSPSGSSERCSARCPVRRAWAAAARRSARNASLSWKASFPSRSGRCLRDGVQFRRSRCDASRSCPP